MRAGKLRHRGHVQSPVESDDTDGAVVIDEWDTIGIRWMSVEYLSGRELFLAQQVQANVNVRIRMRYLADVLPRYRVGLLTASASATATATGTGGDETDFDKIFNIEHVNDVEERHRELILLCKEAP